jgi:hypothetical protein
VPDDRKYNYRKTLREKFKEWGIKPAAENGIKGRANGSIELGIWQKPLEEDKFNYNGIHRESLERDKNEVFRFLWENRKYLNIFDDAYTWVISLRPCVRVAPDGFILKETVSEYRQMIDVEASKLAGVYPGLKKPQGMPVDTPVRLNGGGVLIFDEFGHLKYHISSRINNYQRQNNRLEYLWRNQIHDRKKRYGFSDGSSKGQRFALMHMRRDGIQDEKEEWEDE